MVSENLDDEVVLVRAMYDFDSEDATNLTFKKDDVIQVLAQLESGWWAGHCQGRQGWFPSNYVELLNEDDLEDSDEDEEGDDLDVSAPPLSSLSRIDLSLDKIIFCALCWYL